MLETKPIPPPMKPTDKGITSQLRELHGLLSLYLEGVTRRTIYTSARRLGWKAITRTEGKGIRVWRGDTLEDAPEPEIVTEEPVTHQEKLANLRAMLAPIEAGQPNVFAQPEPVDGWLGWSEERSTYDEPAGETVYYREHIKTRKRREIRRETYYG